MDDVTHILCPMCHQQNLRRARFCQHCGHDVMLNNDRPSDHRRYVITRVIKQGGQGAIYEGLDEDGKVYAIKEMHDRFTNANERQEAIQRFNDEAEILQRLNHPRIPRVYSHFRDEGRHYLTMDFVRGDDLEELVQRTGPFAEPRVLVWADQICDVLEHLHGKGLIYRDMKPSNVMVEHEHDGIKVVDFGITKLFKPTERGTQIGTPGYAPPEQYQGLATPQSDIYAMAATLHHLLTGRDPTDQLPFSYPAARTLVPTISQRTSDALQQALQKVPQDRFATVQAFRRALMPQALPQRPQVRVAPPTVHIPQAAAAQVAAPPAVAPGKVVVPPAVAPGRVTAPPAPQPVVPQAPAAQPNRKRRGCVTRIAGFIRMIINLFFIALIALSIYVGVQRPAWAEPYVAPLIELIERQDGSMAEPIPGS
ncbi:protein kinase [Candidatus Chloroploca sp. M-50]|uniref:non-specific serine/threonine protein kinase n=1 Tax=Candidatus Chloroploca mongolica TaxID=2528176 RepID=A0ABS4D7I6_9CHLR|nr:serine/threonine-protein kinase [Candidatus Chloroploca mongolica]MBP1465413.1 protein kinase [Candidatus Chloroploca mongolica]